jgi:hypothetical protein
VVRHAPGNALPLSFVALLPPQIFAIVIFRITRLRALLQGWTLGTD